VTEELRAFISDMRVICLQIIHGIMHESRIGILSKFYGGREQGSLSVIVARYRQPEFHTAPPPIPRGRGETC